MNRNKVLALTIVTVGMASLIISLAFAAQTGNVWELRDKNGQFGVKITTGTTAADVELSGAGLNASDANRGTLPNARLDSSSVTLLGNAYNSANGPVKLDASAFVPNANLDSSSVTKLGPSIESSEITSLDASTKLTGQVPVANGGTAGATASAARSNLAVPGLADNNTFTGTNVFQSTVTAQAANAGAVSQLWANQSGVVKATMTAAGAMSAFSFSGDGSGLTGVQANTVAASSVTPGSFQNSATLFTFPTTITINGLDFLGSLSGAQIGATTCSARPCVAFNNQDFDWYTTTGTALGQFRNSRTGTGVTQ